MRISLATTILLCGAGALAGCAGRQIQVTELPSSADPTAELSRLETSFENAQKEHLALLSPNYFADSSKALNEARELKADGASNDRLLHQISVSQSYLAKAQETASLSRVTFAPVLTARQDAVTAGAHAAFAGDFASVDRDFQKAAINVEEGNTGKAEGQRGDLIRKYQALEKDGLRQAELDPAKRNIELAKKLDAESIAPKTLAQAERSVAATEQAIDSNPKQRDLIRSRGQEARRNSEFLVRVTREAARSGGSESAALTVLGQQERIASLQAESGAQNEKINQQRERMAKLESDSERFDRIRSYFKPEEADVIRRDGEVVIRLKALSFKTGSAVIASEDYDILSRANKAVQSSPGSEIVIEGHADSTGPKAVNDKLSASRAKAVKEFLVANEAAPAESIRSEGKGYSEPIASNKSDEGRAQNRRVDIRIESAESVG